MIVNNQSQTIDLFGGARARARTLVEPLERRVLFSSEAGDLIDLAAGTTSARTEAELVQPASTFVGPIQYPSTTSSFVGPISPNPAPGDGSPDNSTTIPPRPPSDFRYVLRPGQGFAGPTDQPAPVGDPSAPGYDAKAIARWDVVPYQTFDGIFHIGVVAFHMNGIDRVDFSVNGGDWTAVRSMTQNPQTDVYEYTATLRASDFPDGPLEVRAIAWPTVGEPRVLQGLDWTDWTMNRGEHSLVLNANPGNTLPVHTRYVSQARGNDDTGDGTFENPFATIREASHSIYWANRGAGGGHNLNGGEILLEAGDYNYHINRSMVEPDRATGRLMTLRPADGVAKQDVRITSSTHPGLWRNFVKIQGIVIEGTNIWGNGGFIWFDDVEFIGLGSDVAAINVNNGSNPQFWTNSNISDTQVAVRMATIARNVRLENMGEDAFKFVDLIVNAVVKNIVLPSGSPWHPDVWQYFGQSADSPVQNLIVYGLVAEENISGQGVGPTHVKDVAFINMTVNNHSPTSAFQNWQAWGKMHHCYVLNSTFIGNQNLFREDAATPADRKNVVLENSVFDPMVGIPDGVEWR